jgi:1,4-alpha-glucan branching enzyme
MLKRYVSGIDGNTLSGGDVMSLKKQYLTTKPICKVTFRLSKDETNAAETANVVGEFNDWNTVATPMKKTSAGNFSVTVNLAFGREFQYRYLLNGDNWINDPAADKYVPVPDMGTDNSVVVIENRELKKKSAAKKKPAAKKTTAKKSAAKKSTAKTAKAGKAA